MNARLRLLTPIPQTHDFEDGDMTITLVVPRACIGQPITVKLEHATPPQRPHVLESPRHEQPEEFELDLDSPEIISVARITGAPLPTQLQAIALDQLDSRHDFVNDEGEIELDLDSPEIVAVFYDNLRPIEPTVSLQPTRKAA